MKIVTVDWIDACSRSKWDDQSEILKSRQCYPCQSTGYLVKNTKEEVVVAATIADDGQCGDRIGIPRGMVKSIKVLGKVGKIRK